MNLLQRIATRAASWWNDRDTLGRWGALVPSALGLRSGVVVDPKSALALAAAYAAVNVISTDVASLPLKVYRKRRGPGRDEVTDHPVAELLSGSPDGETTSMRWRQAWLGHALGWGNGYNEITFDGDGMPTGLYLIDPATTQPERRPQDSRLYYRHATGTLPPYKVLHLAGLGFDGLCGYSPVKLAREAFALGLAAESFGASFFGNGSRPSGVLTTDKTLKEDAVKNLRKSWAELHQGVDNAGRVAVLEQGLKFEKLTIDPEDAQFIATRQFQVVEIARLYRVPPNKIGDYSQSHLANIEAANLDYMTTTLMPWCEAIEQEINRKLFTADERKQGYYVEHNMAAFLRGDMRSRAEFYKTMRDLGVFSPNDICERENLNPIGPEGDVRLVPLNMTSLANAGAPPEPAPAPPVRSSLNGNGAIHHG